MFIKQETRLLGKDMIHNCQDWTQKKHTFSNEKMEIWTCNGVWFVDTHPEMFMFNVFEKFYIHRCIKKSKIKKSIKAELEES